MMRNKEREVDPTGNSSVFVAMEVAVGVDAHVSIYICIRKTVFQLRSFLQEVQRAICNCRGLFSLPFRIRWRLSCPILSVYKIKPQKAYINTQSKHLHKVQVMEKFSSMTELIIDELYIEAASWDTGTLRDDEPSKTPSHQWMDRFMNPGCKMFRCYLFPGWLRDNWTNEYNTGQRMIFWSWEHKKYPLQL